MSAEAGGTGADKRIDDSAIAAEKAFNGEFVEDSSTVAEQTMVAVLDFVLNWEFSLGFVMAVERLVGIVRDIVAKL